MTERGTSSVVWSGQWVADRLGVGLKDGPGADLGDGLGVGGGRGEVLRDLLGLALRRNPKRAHLLVSNVLGKHIPQRPHIVYGAGLRLGRRVRELLGDADAARAVVLGYAETATGLGHSVADGLALAPYLHSTRRPVAGVEPVGGFEEEHSHATSHLLLPEDPSLLAGDGPLVLVDDEFSTGNTVLNTITALHRRFPRDRYVVVALVDMRSAEDRGRLDAFAAGLGAKVDLVALAAGTVRLPEGVLKRGQELVASHASHEPHEGVRGPEQGDGVAVGACTRVDVVWPQGVPDGGRHGFTPEHRTRLEAALPGMAARIARELTAGGAGEAASQPGDAPPPGTADGFAPGPDTGPEAQPPRAPRRVLVLGFEELMYAPLRLAKALDEALNGATPYGDALNGARDDAVGVATGTPDEARGETTDGTPGRGEPGEATPPGGAVPDGAVSAGAAPGDAESGGTASSNAAPGGTAPGGAVPRRGVEVRFSTTTRSPVLAVDDPGYAIRTRLTFPAHDAPADGPGFRYAYNVAPGADPTRRFDAVVAVVDSAADTPELHAPDGLLARLAAHTDRLLLAVVPSYTPEPPTPDRQAAPPMAQPLRGPAFSSYAPDEVGWLLQDFSDVTLEAPIEEREEAIQSGGAHYAESLPVEYQPSEAYQALFRAALDASAARIARAVGAVTETVLAERGPRPVLVSLARAGTPVGVLMRRWALHARGLDLPHYAISIVRGRGIDTVALRWLADRHDPADVVFVDGWTGKGAITRELAEAVKPYPGFDPRIAVLADPGRCVETYGTRDDFLIPSACLNSTVSGLVSRTVLRADLVGPDDFHGAKYYRELAAADLSAFFLDAISARFEEVAEQVAAEVKELAAADRAPTWEGWAAVERISEEYGIHDVNLVKPGVGETTRVLLRRVPWKVLALRGVGADLDHVRLLAEQRGVPVEEVDDLPYSCVGLIHPRYTRGATGADGRAVTAP